MALEELKKEDQIHVINEIELMIDASVLPYTAGNEIDYIKNAYGQGFAITPSNGSSC